MNEWMNERSIYIALYCVLLYTQSALQSYEGVSLQPPPVVDRPKATLKPETLFCLCNLSSYNTFGLLESLHN